ncbi:ABC transporter permease [Actinosynnema sp. CA-299493]
MVGYLATRLGSMLLTLVAASIGLFALIHAAPGDPVTAMLSPDELGNSEAYVRARERELGLDRSVVDQYLLWAGRAVRGDLGTSFRNGTPVADLLLARLGPTVALVGTVVVGSAVFALVLGFLAAPRKGTAVDHVIGTASLVVMSVPAFFVGMLAMHVFAFGLRWLPSTGTGDDGAVDLVRHLIMPAAVLGLAETARLTRFVRAGLLEELGADYVRTALAKGASPTRARVHALRNSLLPLITLLVVGVPELLGSTVVVEILFSWPGVGQLTVDAITYRDYPVIIGFGVVVTVVVLLGNFLGDFLYRLADPRVRVR